MREITGTGWLSSDGEFFPCSTFAHVSTAEVLTLKFGRTASGIKAEDLLRSLGWISITIRSWREHGYDFIFNHRVSHSDIQISMIKSFTEKDDVKDNISDTGKFHLSILLDDE